MVPPGGDSGRLGFTTEKTKSIEIMNIKFSAYEKEIFSYVANYYFGFYS